MIAVVLSLVLIIGLLSVCALADDNTGIITIKAYDGQHKVISGVILTVKQSGKNVASGTTGSDGSYTATVPFGKYAIQASAPDGYVLAEYDAETASYKTILSSDTKETVTVSATPVDRTYTVIPETIDKNVQIFTHDLEGNAVSGVEVEIDNEDTKTEESSGATNSKGLFTDKLTKGNYSYTVKSLPAGYMLVEVDDDNNPVSIIDLEDATWKIKLNAEDKLYEGNLTVVKKAEFKEATIALYTADEDGKYTEGVSGAKVSVTKDGASKAAASGTTGSDGTYTALLAPGTYSYVFESVPSGYTFVKVDTKGNVTDTVDLEDAKGTLDLTSADSAEVEWFVKADKDAKALRLSVEDEDGIGVMGVKISVTQTDDKNKTVEVASGITGSDGSFFALLSAGKYTVKVTEMPENYVLIKRDKTELKNVKTDSQEIEFKDESKEVTISYTAAVGTQQDDTSDPCKNYTDVDRSAWYHSAVDYSIVKGIMVGSNNQFMPQSEVTRAMVVQVLYAKEGKPVTNATSPFTDVSSKSYYKDAVNWAYSRGLAAGYSDTQFAPNQSVSRQELVTFLRAYANYKGLDTKASADLSGYTDANEISNYAVENVRWAVTKGLITGRTLTTLVPKGTATRAEFAQIMMNFDNLS